MKIGILTWYKEINHGAVLQAYASQMNLRNIGVETGLLDYDRKAKVNISGAKVFSMRLKRLLTGDYKYRKAYVLFKQEKQRLFKHFLDENITVLGNCYKCHCDGIMVGSDMVFNLIEGYSPYMFGIGIDTNFLFSYAASAGGSTLKLAEQLNVRTEIAGALCRFHKVGCRDESTKKFVSEISGRNDLYDNIDPVLLYGFENEMKSWNTGKWEKYPPFILVYAYHGNLNSKSEVSAIKKWAKSNNLKIISCGNYHPWCDESVNVDPKEFLEMFMAAKAVITDTFHGTVFSIICEKKFCSIIRGNAFKLRYLLNQAGMESQIASNHSQIESILNKSIDYENCNKWLAVARDQSQQYIKMCLSEIASEM